MSGLTLAGIGAARCRTVGDELAALFASCGAALDAPTVRTIRRACEGNPVARNELVGIARAAIEMLGEAGWAAQADTSALRAALDDMDAPASIEEQREWFEARASRDP